MSANGIKCGNCKEYHATIQDVRDCHKVGKPARQRDDVPRNSWEIPASGSISDGTISVSEVEVTDGIWILNDTIYKVQVAVHGSGGLYGKRLVIDGEGAGPNGEPAPHHWEYEKGVAYKLRDGGRKMTLKEAEEFGALYGFCCRCGRTLTREESIERGIGPVCAGKF